jgi:hypothetical protein
MFSQCLDPDNSDRSPRADACLREEPDEEDDEEEEQEEAEAGTVNDDAGDDDGENGGGYAVPAYRLCPC